MAKGVHPAASHHLPGFITAPGETDVLMVVSLVCLIAMVVGIGVFYFKLHALPEQIAHKGEKVQFQLVAVLSLIALFTHNHAYWIAALLLAFVRFPDFSAPLAGMANSLAKIADAKRSGAKVTPSPAAKRGAGKSAKTVSAGKSKEAGNA